MVKLNNKGMTITEILLSICIIGIVLVFLFALLMQVRNEDEENNIQSTFLINQSTFIKAIEEDIVNYGVKSISECSLSDANISRETVVTGDEGNYKCVRIEYAADYIKDRIGYIMIYHHYTKYDIVDGEYKGSEPEWMIQYVRGSYTEKCLSNLNADKSSWKNETAVMKAMPEEVDLSETPYLLYTAMANKQKNAASLVIPIVNMKGEHYDINLSFTFTGNDTFICDGDNPKSTESKNLLKCICSSGNSLCTKTYQDYTYDCSQHSTDDEES